ncbi:hypothetical protein D1007_59907 [Hordeum vulgare]|uniref:Late embryogenesis abundant protein LEA-2 subgroup domain-containing protein n=1 Tax=Hordeum vulgare subsp. vulgare TaxID=112509 RepID=A0A8I6YVY4_HORVV|nr:hypothetical protein D1007_59907 [Hordeum vulgare]KAI4981266.1 hypothetical protein ZWY2020_021751 [Hordeum vulgare]
MSDDGDSEVCDGCIDACCCALCLGSIGGKTLFRIVCALVIFAVLATGFTLLVIAFVTRPVGVTVEDAALARLALAKRNTTATALAYDVSFTVAVRNHNWIMRAQHTAPLDAELLFAGARFARVGLATAGGLVQPGNKEVYHAAAAADNSGVALGSAGVAEFVRQSTAGVFHLELRVVGEVRYPPRHHLHKLNAICPLELVPSTATSPATFRKVKCFAFT